MNETTQPETSQAEVEAAIEEFVAAERARDIKTKLSYAEFKELVDVALQNPLIAEEIEGIKDELREHLHAGLSQMFPECAEEPDTKFFGIRAKTNLAKMPGMLEKLFADIHIENIPTDTAQIRGHIAQTINWELRNASCKMDMIEFVENLAGETPHGIGRFASLKAFMDSRKIKREFLRALLPNILQSTFDQSGKGGSREDSRDYTGRYGKSEGINGAI